MLNFREELGKIKKEKLEAGEELLEKQEKIFDKLLCFLRSRTIIELSFPIKFRFAFVRNCVYAKQFEKNGKQLSDHTLFHEKTNLHEEAYILLHLIEEKFKSEGYDIVDGTSADNGAFDVIIKI